ncbi:Iodotyrosine deiodinase 1 [Eumeta japonica]|uniref:Iodotyrosine deiodinase 1 n=1 Tax=Eumeta variegata TaxID=151549 RepID=A0A4C1WKS2_EUMVA|nr:Iodotyrosine deiodinase 1 [Eumeta japonica]
MRPHRRQRTLAAVSPHRSRAEGDVSELLNLYTNLWQGRFSKKKDFPDDEDPEMLVPAIPEDTPHIPYRPVRKTDEEILERSREFYDLMAKRRTVRFFSSEPIPQEVLYNIVKTADKRPSGQHERRFDAPQMNEVAVVIVDNECSRREIIIQRQSNKLKHISETQSNYDALQHPLVFWQDEDGYHFSIQQIDPATGTAPSGAHTEPWTFVIVQDQEMKAAIREIVEEEEEMNYNARMSRQWVTDLKPFGTRHVKPYLTEAPALLLVFRQTYSFRHDGKKRMHYYSETSVAIAAGFILAAVQYCGLTTLTSTPLNCSPRIRVLLSRPANERLELLLPLGRPHPEATVPDISRKPVDEILVKI